MKGQRGMGEESGAPQVVTLPDEPRSQSTEVAHRRALTCRCCNVAAVAPDDARLIAPGVLKRARRR